MLEYLGTTNLAFVRHVFREMVGSYNDMCTLREGHVVRYNTCAQRAVSTLSLKPYFLALRKGASRYGLDAYESDRLESHELRLLALDGLEYSYDFQTEVLTVLPSKPLQAIFEPYWTRRIYNNPSPLRLPERIEQPMIPMPEL